ncbi:WXG100 family type VII secretion target [Streptosporangium saharense]|uniref:ESAT-6-like protein n=1 Tax=Streptosporangium saharense TaxID=1706840 RepID=A0A7W7QS39_9ACTN|nr:WXG100 family type VII secretion target [Streptosporangium saharense]MBB4918678.1 WXG100 family type VII secretion target [Streptosporangium saharense]
MSPAQMKKAGGLAADTAQYVEGLRKGVLTTTQELTASGWLGAASAKFLKAMNEWDRQMALVREDLDKMSRDLGESSITYAAAEQDVEAGMNRVDALINANAR